jgi:hypothetical protein
VASFPAPEAWRSTPPNDLLAAAWLAGYSSHKTRLTYQTMIRSWFDWCALCGLEPLASSSLWVVRCDENGRLQALRSAGRWPARTASSRAVKSRSVWSA